MFLDLIQKCRSIYSSSWLAREFFYGRCIRKYGLLSVLHSLRQPTFKKFENLTSANAFLAKNW